MTAPRCDHPMSGGQRCGKPAGHRNPKHLTEAAYARMMLPASVRQALRAARRAIRPAWTDQQRDAALALCARARDAADARQLLEACGLLPYTPGPHQTYAYGRRS